jgi:predicted Zn finger-like uncharacterized protein
MFKVVPDQLRISEGWVRCGQCDEVFDANAFLQTRSAPEPAAARKESLPETPTSSPEQPSVEAETVHGPDPEPAFEIDVQKTALPDAEPEAVVAEVAAVAVAEVDVLDVVPGVEMSVEHIQAVAMDLPAVVSREVRHREPEEISVSFMTAGQKADVPTRRGMSALWGLLATVLLMVLVAQVLVQERDRIAATESAAVALLNPLCELTGCSISPLQQIESVVIDSSAFTKIRPDLYRLSFSLKNMAMVDVATPALELTLTDRQDQALVRRVFTASELAALKPVLAAGSEWAASMSVSIQLPGAVDRISGYRLLAFYP